MIGVCPSCGDRLEPEQIHDTKPARHADGPYVHTNWICPRCNRVAYCQLEREQ